MIQSIKTIGVIGAGTMGSGIAQVSAQHGFHTLLFDIDKEIIEKAKKPIRQNLNYLVDKQKITLEEKENIFTTSKLFLFAYSFNFTT